MDLTMAYNRQTHASSSATESSKHMKTAFAIGLMIIILLYIMYSLFSFDKSMLWEMSLVPLIGLQVLLLMIFWTFYNKSHAPPQEDAVTHVDQECTRQRPDEQEESNALPGYEEDFCSIRFPLVYPSAPSPSDLPTYEEMVRTQGSSTVEPATPPPQYEDKGPEYLQLADYTCIGGDQYVLEQENGALQSSIQ